MHTKTHKAIYFQFVGVALAQISNFALIYLYYRVTSKKYETSETTVRNLYGLFPNILLNYLFL